jgi:hypothetical protein
MGWRRVNALFGLPGFSSLSSREQRWCSRAQDRVEVRARRSLRQARLHAATCGETPSGGGGTLAASLAHNPSASLRAGSAGEGGKGRELHVGLRVADARESGASRFVGRWRGTMMAGGSVGL